MYEQSVLLKLITEYSGAAWKDAITDQAKLEQAIRNAYDDLEQFNRTIANTEDLLKATAGTDYFEGTEKQLRNVGIMAENTAEHLEALIAAFRESEQDGDLLETELEEIESALEKFNTTLTESRGEQEKAATAAKEFKDEQEKLAQVLDVSADDLMRASDGGYLAARAYQTAAGEVIDFAQAANRAEKETEQLYSSSEKLTYNIRGLDDAYGKLNVPVGDMTRLEKATRGAAEGQEKLERETKDANQQLSKQKTEVSGLAGALGGLETYLAASIIGATTFAVFNKLEDAVRATWDFVKESEAAFAEYDFMVRQTFAQTPDIGFAFDDISAQTRNLGQDLGYLPNEVMPAVRKALNIGIDEFAVFEGLEAAGKSARVSGAGIEETFVSAASTAKAYGTEIYSLNEILDIYSTITQNSVLEQQDLNAGLSEIVNTGAQAGIGLDEIAAAMITMSNQGDGMKEMTDLLSNLFIQISLSGTELGKAFESAAGIDWFGFIEQGGTLTQALAILEDQSERTGISLANMIGGDSKFYRDTRATLGVLELTNQHTADFRANVEQTSNSTGRLDQSYEEVAESTAVLLERTEAAKSSFQTFMGEALEPTTRAYNELKIAAFEAGIEIFKGITAEREQAEATAAAWQDAEAEIDSYTQQLVALGNESEYAYQALNVVYELFGFTEGSATSAEQVENYNTALATTLALLSEDPGTTLPEILEAIDYAIRGINTDVEQFAGIMYDSWDNAIVPISTAEQTIANARIQMELMSKEFQNFKTVATEVKDGDTFDAYIEGEITAVRLAGVDAPETSSEWDKFYAEYLGFDPGQQATEITQDLVLGGTVTLGPEIAESYERSVREVFVDDERLATILAREGLAIPMYIDLDDKDAQREITAAYEQAAVAGKGIFQNAEIQQGFLDGTITSLFEVKAAWEEIQAASAAAKDEAAGYTNAVLGVSGAFEAMREAQAEARDAEESGEGLKEAKEAEQKAIEDLTGSYIELGAAAFTSNSESAAASLDLYVALGLLTEEERQLREEHLALEAAMGAAGSIFADMGYDAEVAAVGIEGLASGLYATVDAALAAAAANQAFVDIAGRVGDNELADKLYRQQLGDEADALNVVATVDVDTSNYFTEVQHVKDDLLEIDDTNYEAIMDLNTSVFDEKMDIVLGISEAWDAADYESAFGAEGIDTTADDIEELKQLAIDYANGDYHAYIYTHYRTDGDPYTGVPEGSRISGGSIYTSGRYYVGEDGPEMVTLPRGSHVTPNNELERNGPVTINQIIRGDAAATADHMSHAMIRDLRKFGLI